MPFAGIRVPEAAPPQRGAPAARLKRAFHRASLGLHPDRLTGMPTYRRAEATEIFKTLKEAYDKEVEESPLAA